MSEKYTIKEVSELFQVPKSTLRYWEKENIIGSNRNDGNEYREYTTEDLIVIADMLFYRSLNIPIKNLKHIYGNSIQNNMDLLYASYDRIDKQIEQLKLVQSKIKKRLTAGIIYENLIHDTPTYAKPHFNHIVHLHMGTKSENIIHYIQDQSVLAFVLDTKETSLKIYGTIKDEIQTNDEVLWSKKSNVRYYPCYMKVRNGEIDMEVLQPFLDKAKSLSSSLGNLIGTYLITDKEDDFYQVWIELETAL